MTLFNTLEIRREIVEQFLIENNCSCKQILFEKYIWEREEKKFEIPRNKNNWLSKSQVREILKSVNLEISDFNCFVSMHTSDFIRLIQYSSK